MILSVRVKPGSKKPGIEIAADNTIVVKVAAHPIEGKANTAVRQSLAAALGIAPAHVKLVGGEKSKTKRFEIPDGTALTNLVKNGI
jgi:uncharacterized protein